MNNKQLEVWLRGPVPDICAALQPVAHALLQAAEEVHACMEAFDTSLLWLRPAGLASVGFHLQHMAGVQDRLFTYANARPLNADQLRMLETEGQSSGQPNELQALLARYLQQTRHSIEELKKFNNADLFAARGVGRALVPSTVIGLLVHAAEHTMRHLGQLLVTARIVQANAVAGDR